MMPEVPGEVAAFRDKLCVSVGKLADALIMQVSSRVEEEKYGEALELLEKLNLIGSVASKYCVRR